MSTRFLFFVFFLPQRHTLHILFYGFALRKLQTAWHQTRQKASELLKETYVSFRSCCACIQMRDYQDILGRKVNIIQYFIYFRQTEGHLRFSLANEDMQLTDTSNVCLLCGPDIQKTRRESMHFFAGTWVLLA